MNLFDPGSLARATYTGSLKLPYPPFSLTGDYNTSTETVVFGQQLDLEFGGLSLEYTVEVDLSISQIVRRLFHGHLDHPLGIDITGYFDGINCLVDLSGSVKVPTEEVSIMAGVVLQYCNNCSRICSARAVHLVVDLYQPWNISLNGSYSLSDDNITTVSVGGTVSIEAIMIEVFTVLESIGGNTTVSNLGLEIKLPDPISTQLAGSYSRDTEIASFSGDLTLQQIQFMLQLRADIGKRTLSELTLSGALSSPFPITLYASYELNNKSSHIMAGGSLMIDNFLDLMMMAQIDLMSQTILHFDLMGMLNQPLAVAVTAHYNILPSSELTLAGTISTQGGHHAIMVQTVLNVSSNPISIIALKLSGVFPPPLDFISFTGTYDQDSSCALLTGIVVKQLFDLNITTNLQFVDNESPTITSVQVQILFHHPINLLFEGEYSYLNDTDANLIDIHGIFNIPLVSFSTELMLIIAGMETLTLSRLHFVGTIPPPLGLQIQGDFDQMSSSVVLTGQLAFSFVQLNASTTYQFTDNVHNISASLVDVELRGSLTSPFLLEVEGIYALSTSIFSLGGLLTVSEYLTVTATLHVNTSTTPISLDLITLKGAFMTPIQFDGEFEGDYNRMTQMATLMSNLSIGPILFSAEAKLIQLENVFSLQSVEITGTTADPLSLAVHGTYIPGNATELDLYGNLHIGPIILEGTAHAEQDSNTKHSIFTMIGFTSNINDPFDLTLLGTYDYGGALSLSGSTSVFSIIYIEVSALLNLTAMPRTLDSLSIHGQLQSPLSGNVTAEYTLSSGNLVLNGATEIAAVHFIVEVVFNTTFPVSIQFVRFTTTFDPLSIMLVGIYNREMQQINLRGILSIPTLAVDIIATTHIELLEQVPTHSNLMLSVNFSSPQLYLAGFYNASAQNALLSGYLSLANLEITACAILHLETMKYLDTISISISYTIPFGDMPVFQLEGSYDQSTSLVILEGRIVRSKRSSELSFKGSKSIVRKELVVRSLQPSQSNTLNSNDIIRGILILSTSSSQAVQVIALRFPDLDIAALVNRYIGINWPADSFPLNFRDLAVYMANNDVTHENIDYKVGYHARGEVKIFIFPTVILDASLVTEPQRQFSAHLTLKDTVDWGLIAICGVGDSSCSITGPSLTIEVGSGTNRFIFEAGFRLFDIYIGTVELTVGNKLLTASIHQQVSDLLPSEFKIFWNDTHFYTSLAFPSIHFPDFSFNNVKSVDICRQIGGYIGMFIIDAPFHIDTHMFANRTWFGIVLSGFVELQVLHQDVVMVNITPIAIGVSLPSDQPYTLNLFQDLVKQAIKDAGPQIIDGILRNHQAAGILLASELVQKEVGAIATAICMHILEEAGEAAAAGITAGAAGGIAVVGSLGSFIVGGLLNLLGGNDDDSSGDQEAIDDIMNSLQLSCSNMNGGCQQNCIQDGKQARCSCNEDEGYILNLMDGSSCIRKLTVLISRTYKTSIIFMMKTACC